MEVKQEYLEKLRAMIGNNTLEIDGEPEIWIMKYNGHTVALVDGKYAYHQKSKAISCLVDVIKRDFAAYILDKFGEREWVNSDLYCKELIYNLIVDGKLEIVRVY